MGSGQSRHKSRRALSAHINQKNRSPASASSLARCMTVYPGPRGTHTHADTHRTAKPGKTVQRHPSLFQRYCVRSAVVAFSLDSSPDKGMGDGRGDGGTASEGAHARADTHSTPVTTGTSRDNSNNCDDDDDDNNIRSQAESSSKCASNVADGWSSGGSLGVAEGKADRHQLLLSKALHHYIRMGGDFDIIERLIGCGADVNYRETGRKAVGAKRQTSLHIACSVGFYRVVELILDQNNDKDREGEGVDTSTGTSVGGAGRASGGFDINVRDGQGQTPMIVAALAGHTSIVRLLMDRGADTDLQSQHGYSPLMCACVQGYASIARVLLRKEGRAAAGSPGARVGRGRPAQVNEVNAQNGMTPLIIAALLGDTEICRILLANGAEVDVVDGTDMSAFQYAKAEQHEGVLTLLSTRKVNKAVEMLKFHKMQREQKIV